MMSIFAPVHPYQRQIVDKRVWRELVIFFPAAAPFRAESSECLECSGDCANERKAEQAVKREREQEIALPVLRALYGRKAGVRQARVLLGGGRLCRSVRLPSAWPLSTFFFVVPL